MPRNHQTGICYAKTSSMSEPLGLTQPVDQVPSTADAKVRAPTLKLTSLSKSRELVKTSTIAMHWLNLPFVDALITVSKLYKVISEMAFNYQAQHQDAFFDQYPGLIIRSEAEKAEKPVLTTTEIRRSYKLFSKRLAHYYYSYVEWKKLQTGALANLAIVGKLNGKSVIRDLASACRLSYINTNCNGYQKFPQPKGLEDYILRYSGYATGSDTTGCDILSFPLWRTEVFGSPAQKFFSLSQLVVSDKNGAPTPVDLSNLETNYEGASSLIRHMAEIVKQYGADYDGDVTPFGDYEPPIMPSVENGAVITFSNGQNAVNTGTAGYAAYDQLHAKQPMPSSMKDNLVGRLWNNYHAITEYMMNVFPQMMNENSDMRAFAMGSLGILQDSSDAGKIVWALRDIQNTSISDLTARMTYTAGAKYNTATLLKFSPFLYDENGRVDSLTVFEQNFERYSVDDDNPTVFIKQAKTWPHLNPEIFVKGDLDGSTPLVLNATPSLSREMAFVQESGPSNLPSKAFAGKNATLFDYARTCGIATDKTAVLLGGVDKATALSMVLNSGDEKAVVFTECPDTLFVTNQLPIDASDISQAGFNIMLSYDNKNPSEWEAGYRDITNFRRPETIADDSNKFDVQFGGAGELGSDPKINVPYLRCFGKDPVSGKPILAHTANPNYMNAVKHAFIFIGVGIFNLPAISFALPSSGYFKSEIYDPRSGTEPDANPYKVILDQILKPIDQVTQAGADIAEMLIRAFDFDGKLMEQGAYGSLRLNPFLAIRDEWQTAGMHNRAAMLNEYAFDPSYGPVTPAIEPSLYGDRNYLMPIAEYSDDAGAMLESWDSISPISFSLPAYRMDERTGVDQAKVSAMPVAYDQFHTPIGNAFQELLQITFPNIKVGKNGLFAVADEPCKVMFFDFQRSVLAMASLINVEYMGVDKTVPFWTSQDLIKLDAYPAFPKNGTLPEENIQAEARKPNASSRNTERPGYTPSPNFSGKTEAGASINALKDDAAMKKDSTNAVSSSKRSAGPVINTGSQMLVNRDGTESRSANRRAKRGRRRGRGGVPTDAPSVTTSPLEKEMNAMYNA